MVDLCQSAAIIILALSVIRLRKQVDALQREVHRGKEDEDEDQEQDRRHHTRVLPLRVHPSDPRARQRHAHLFPVCVHGILLRSRGEHQRTEGRFVTTLVRDLITAVVSGVVLWSLWGLYHVVMRAVRREKK